MSSSETINLPELPSAQVSPTNSELESFSKLLDVGDLLSGLSDVRESGDKFQAARIAFIERIILLSGGAITLVFTAISTLSPHLRDKRAMIHNTDFLIASCWLLIATIIAGLSSTRVLTKLRMFLELEDITLQGCARIKTRLIAIPGINEKEIDKLQLLQPDLKTQKRLRNLKRAAGILEWVTHILLVSAFIFLALFIQVNIRLMLNV